VCVDEAGREGEGGADAGTFALQEVREGGRRCGWRRLSVSRESFNVSVHMCVCVVCVWEFNCRVHLRPANGGVSAFVYSLTATRSSGEDG
jgi:hypothetical protein